MDMLMSLVGKDYLHKSRNKEDYLRIVQDKLQVFHGVSRKVADCVALFSLKQDDAIPVDTHVWNLGRRDWDVNSLWKDTNSRTPTVYCQVGDMFRSTVSPKAGWVHSLLFAAEIPSLHAALPEDIIQEMEQVSKKR